MIDNLTLIERFELYLTDIEKNKEIKGKTQVLKSIRNRIKRDIRSQVFNNDNRSAQEFLRPPKRVKFSLIGEEREEKGLFKGVDSQTGFFVFGTGHGDIMYNPKRIIFMDYDEID